MRKFITNWRQLKSDEEGVTLVEYGIAIALAVALGTAGLSSLGDEISDGMTAAGAQMPNGAAVAPANP